MSALVTDGRTLRGMTKAGFIVWTPGVDRHWTGLKARRYFVESGPKLKNWYDVFDYRGQSYRLRYVDGCFHPFVHRMGIQGPSFI